MTTQRNNLREDVKFRILRLLQDNPEMSQRELAKAVSLSTGGIHYV
ncbi:winged helix-turn-helix transcriptional regulator, partial [Amylibacter sp.]|nr:winged helix-turn-helix transcriptional regulator [Amylibacter sp.]